MTQQPAVCLSDNQFQDLLGRLGVNNTNNGNPNDDGGATRSKSVKPERPTIDIDTTEGEWGLFEDNWSRFKRMAKLTAIADIRDNLRQCCSAQLNKRLFDVKGAATLNAATEENLLAWIKEIAVQGVHKEVHRTQFVHLKQKQGERINSFHGRLKAEARLCDFRMTSPETCGNADCTCANHGVQVSYQDDMVATQLVAGLYNSDHQSKVLSESSTLVTLDDKLKRLLVIEKSDTSLSTLGSNEAFTNYTGSNKKSSSGYKKQWQNKDQEQQAETAGDITCTVCGKKHAQCKTCEGFHKCTTRCKFCKKKGHIKNCCQKLLKLSVAAANIKVENSGNMDEEEEVVFSYSISVLQKQTLSEKETIFNSLTISVHQFSKYLLSHMECTDGTFHAVKPAKAPLIQVTCRLLVQNHLTYGRTLPLRKKRRVKAEGLADTGAQVCTSGPRLLSCFGIDENFLIPTKLQVKGITHSPVTMMGALFLEVSANGIYTQQIVYIVREARSLILSETTLKNLGVIPLNFPTAGTYETPTVQTAGDDQSRMVIPTTPSGTDATVARSVVMNTCGCPVRTEVPPIPTNIPVEKPEGNRSLLHKWILNYYKTSAFNICPHQLIPAITGPDMIIVTVDGAEPVAVNSPIPTAHHWKKEVKGLLDQNCSMGVIEPLPAGIPQTWCSRMLTTAKTNGKPRIVVDLQPLNAVSKRATHHTPSPWNLACSVPKGMKKSILDASNGYHSIPLAEESRDKTTFITEWGRYRYCRAPQGWTGSGDAFTKRFDDITSGIKDVVRCIDDSLL